jgi:cell division protein FtsW
MHPAHWQRIALLAIVLGLCGFGLVMIASTTAIGTAAVKADGGVTWAFLCKQGAAMLAGLAAAAAISWLGVERLRDPRLVAIAAGGAILALLVVLAVGRTVNGAKRWIDLGPVNLQPAELAKLALVLGTAWILANAAERVRTLRWGVGLPLLGFAVLGGLVYLTKDLGSVVVMGVVLLAMMLMAGAPLWQTLLGGACALPLLSYVAVWQVSYRRDRFFAFLDPWSSDGPASYHLQQSFIAIGSGGVGGVGLGQSTAKLSFLPERHTDFIFAVVCEELGMIGAMTLAGLFLALVGVGLSIAQQSRDVHRRLLATGATMILGTQAFWNMLVVVGAAPTKGLTLPFISYGGSSVAVCIVLVGILDACARANARDQLTSSFTRCAIGARTTRQLRAPTGFASSAPTRATTAG